MCSSMSFQTSTGGEEIIAYCALVGFQACVRFEVGFQNTQRIKLPEIAEITHYYSLDEYEKKEWKNLKVKKINK